MESEEVETVVSEEGSVMEVEASSAASSRAWDLGSA